MNGLYAFKIFNCWGACVQTDDGWHDFESCWWEARYMLNVWFNMKGTRTTVEVYSLRSGRPRRVKRLERNY